MKTAVDDGSDARDINKEEVMNGRRSFLKGIIVAMAGCACLVAPRPKLVAFPVLPDFASEPSGFELGWFRLEKTEKGYVVPKLLATLTEGVVIVTRSSHPGRLAVYSQSAWFQLTGGLRQIPADVRHAVIRLVIAPAHEIDLRDPYLEIPEFLGAYSGLGNRSLLLAYDGQKGFLQAA